MRDRRLSRGEEKRLLDAALAMNTWQHGYVGPLMHDRIIGALELCCRLSEMLLVQNKRVDWDTHTIGIPGHTTQDSENRRQAEAASAASDGRRLARRPRSRVAAGLTRTRSHARAGAYVMAGLLVCTGLPGEAVTLLGHQGSGRERTGRARAGTSRRASCTSPRRRCTRSGS